MFAVGFLMFFVTYVIIQLLPKEFFDRMGSWEPSTLSLLIGCLFLLLLIGGITLMIISASQLFFEYLP